MADRALSVAVSAGAGALATVAGIYLVNKFKQVVRRNRPKMRLFHKHVLLSTRCTWLIAELGAEGDFEVSDMGDTICSAIKDPQDSSELLAFRKDGADAPSILPSTADPTFQVVELNPSRKKTSGRDGNSDDGYVDGDEEAEYDGEEMLPDYPDPDLEPTIPTLALNDEFTMIEGAAICMYLADLYQQFLPEPQHKAEYYSWIMYSATTFDNILKTLQHQLVDTPENERNSDLLEPALKAFDSFARALSETLDRHRYLCGNYFTAADCVMGFTLWWAYTIEDGSLLYDYPVLLRYLHKLQSRPAFQRTFGVVNRWDWIRCFPTFIRAINHG